MVTYSTKNYDMFITDRDKTGHWSTQNCEKLIKNLMQSISYRNLLAWRPIIVTKNFLVIDGLHRLEAAKRLGVEIYYEVIQTEIQLDSSDQAID